MPQGFFNSSALSTTSAAATSAVVPRCGACGLFKTCNSPKMPVTGKGEMGILIVGEAPGAEEDKKNKQFIGRSGQLLRDTLGGLGVELDVDCWKTNSLICRPSNNVKPTTEQIGHCLPNLRKTIDELKPKIIIALGAAATMAVLLPTYNAVENAVGPWVGWQIPSQSYNAWVCPTWHPAYILRTREVAKGDPDPAYTWWQRHLTAAVAHRGRPWRKVPDYANQITLIHDPTDAAKAIRWIMQQGGLTAPDFETNALKPETPGARIYSCGICWEGRRTIAYPWYGAAIAATREYLKSSRNTKVGSNIKFEERWARRLLKTGVTGWVYDTMLGAHLLDNRPDICSLKTQAMIVLGYGTYNATVERYLQDVSSNGLNKISEIELDDLLLYNGLDCLLEAKIAKHKAERLGVAI